MGAAESTPLSGSHQELLQVFVGYSSTPLNDPFWDSLLSFSFPLPKIKPSEYDDATREACTTLALNNRQTGHFGKLLIHMMHALEDAILAADELPLRAINTVYFTRLFVKHLVEYHSSAEVAEHLRVSLTDGEAASVRMTAGSHDLLVPAVRSLLSFVVDHEVNAKTYLLHLEVLNLCIVMASTQLHASIEAGPGEGHIFTDCMMEQVDLVAPFVRKLLLSFMHRLPLPPGLPLYTPPPTGRQGVLRSVGSAAVAVFLLPYYTYSYLMKPASASPSSSASSSTSTPSYSVRASSASSSSGGGSQPGTPLLGTPRGGAGSNGGTVHRTPSIAVGSSSGSRTPLADNSLLLLLALVHYGRLREEEDAVTVLQLPYDSSGSQLNEGSHHKRGQRHEEKTRQGQLGLNLAGGDATSSGHRSYSGREEEEEGLAAGGEEGRVRRDGAALDGGGVLGDAGRSGSDGGLSQPREYRPNPFRTALQGARDSEMIIHPPDLRSPSSSLASTSLPPSSVPLLASTSSSSSPATSSSPAGTVVVSFAQIFDTLGSCLEDDRATLLLYSLLHSNPSFKEYFFVRSDVDTLVLPLLRMLYDTPQRTPNQIYMLLIILLILSQEPSFNAHIHKLILPSVPWYRERILMRIPLGSLLLLILVRTIKFNMGTLKDVYLHTNCLATLANMAPHTCHLSAYAAQRLVSLFHMLSRKYVRLSAIASSSTPGSIIPTSSSPPPHPLNSSYSSGSSNSKAAPRTASYSSSSREGAAASPDVSISIDVSASWVPGEQRENGAAAATAGTDGARKWDSNSNAPGAGEKGAVAVADAAAIAEAASELQVFTDFLRIVLEIINAILTFALPRNPELVYALLHRQELFLPFRNQPRFFELLDNIFNVIDFFNVRMDEKLRESEEGQLSVQRVLDVVVENTRAWRGEGLKMFTELRFSYEEELHPEEFFVPYVWTLIVAHSGIPWNPDCVTLFPVRSVAEFSVQGPEEAYDADSFDTHSEMGRTPRVDIV